MTTPPHPPNQPADSGPETPVTTADEAATPRPGALSTHDIATVPPPGERFVEAHPKTFWERGDRRWALGLQARDGIIVVVMIAIYLVWAGVIFFFEPGIR